MENYNTFTEGMNGDISKSVPVTGTYLEALNFRPQTELGESNGSLVNIKGNECKITYPETHDIYKLRITPYPSGTGGNDVITITINGSTTGSITITSGSTGLQLYNIIKSLPNCYNPSIPNPLATFAVAYNNDYVVISQQPVFKNCGPVGNVTPPVITITRTVVNPNYTLMFINVLNQPVVTQNIGHYVLGHNNLYTIGSTFIGEDIYLLTSDEYSIAGDGNPPYQLFPNDSFTGVGNIWKLQIDDITKEHTLTLLYTNYLDFSIQYPVAPSAITGRYESLNIQRIYWSDFYNKNRTANVADPQLMALDPTLLSVTPSTEFSQPVLSNIIGGNLLTGCYQIAYRLTQDLGSVSNYSELSNMVYLITPDVAAPFETYQGSPTGVSSNKGIVWTINNLDINYDKIEVVVIYRSSAGAVFSATSILTTVIPGTGSITVTYTTDSNPSYVSYTNDEFLNLVSTFTHAKTVDTKDNRLFWGYIKGGIKDLSTWDSRAYRAHSVNADDVILKNNGVYGTYQTLNPFATNGVGNLLESDDTINNYYDVSGSLDTTHGCYYKPNTNELGGTGINISYTFGTTSILADTNRKMYAGGVDYMANPLLANRPFRTMAADSTGYDANQNIQLNALDTPYLYPQRYAYGSNKYPYREGLLKGYQHEEIYRFGIQFFDLEGTPYFVKWIGDIKFPSYDDVNYHNDATAQSYGYTPGGTADFRLNYGAGDLQYTQVMNINFRVDVSALSKVISGYEIVRVERDGNNKTIWGAGLLTPFVRFGYEYNGDNTAQASDNLFLPANFQSKHGFFNIAGIPLPVPHDYYNPYPSQETVETLNAWEYTVTENFKSFDCFDHISGYNRPSYAAGDKLLVRARLVDTNYRKTGSVYSKFFTEDIQPPRISLFIDANDGPCPTVFSGTPGTTNDNSDMPFYLLKFEHERGYGNAITGYQSDIYDIDGGTFVESNATVNLNGFNIINAGTDMYLPTGLCASSRQDTDTYGHPCYGNATTVVHTTAALNLAGTYGCKPPDHGEPDNVYKILALYFKYNASLYGGFGYTERTNNTYISCSEYVPVVHNKLNVNLNVSSLTVYGGDTYTSIYDHQKTVKNVLDAPPSYYRFAGSGLTITSVNFNCSTTLFFPTTGMANAEVRDGVHVNKDLDSSTYAAFDDQLYYDYHSCENNIKKYFPKPLGFSQTTEWINRVYFSQIKINNETQDNWSTYLTNDFYDVEGNYGGINCLISLNNQMYFLQDRAVGILMINPVAMVDAGIGTNVKLGAGKTIEKHQYRALDIGTKHQWSVYRSSNQIIFVDVRHKKIYSYNGSELTPISDAYGQRGFTVKRMHDNLLVNDNPVIGKGVVTTYDYHHNEFLITFLNENPDTHLKDPDRDVNPNREFYTLAYSEPLSKFTSYYSFKPNLYINNNKYLLSNINNINGAKTALKNSLYFHNYGEYGVFYGNPPAESTIKVLINDKPQNTKVFDNLTWLTESIHNNIEWSDDYNIYPGAIADPSFPDNVNNQLDTFSNVRCYNDWQNSDFIPVIITPPNNNVTRKERDFNFQVPRNKFDYNTNLPSTYSLFDPSKLTRTTFGERLRDKYMIVDLVYSNLINNRFIVNLLKTIYRVSDR